MKREDIVALIELPKMAAEQWRHAKRESHKKICSTAIGHCVAKSLPARWRRRPRLSFRSHKTLEIGSRRDELGVAAGVQDEYA